MEAKSFKIALVTVDNGFSSNDRRVLTVDHPLMEAV
jgi:hypothetical protein